MRDYAVELPVFLEADLFRAGWNGAIKPYPAMTPRQKAFQSLRSSLVKKFTDGDTKAAEANALKLFLEINEECGSYYMDTSRMTEAETIAIGESKDFLYRFFFPEDQTTGDRHLTWAEVSSRLGVGNGANIGSFGTDFLSKVGTSLMSATDPALHLLYKQAIACDPLWTDVEFVRTTFRETAIVQGSRLSFVPKTTEISRTICTEPLCNMLFQKGIASVLEDQLRKTLGISLSEQPDKNRELARLGSIDGRFGTIDLSSASDSMSLSLVRLMFPEHVVTMLEKTRSPLTILPDGTKVQLHMVSSMGNAFTFPLQTIFFSAIVYGAYRILGIPFERPFRQSLGNFAVFGDDIIVVKEAYGLVCRLLSLCGFSVNADKSFNEGLFRESCGHDYFSGHNVRGVYIKTLQDVSDRYSAINRLNRWSAKWDTPLPDVISVLLRGTRILPIPFDEQDNAGIKVPASFLRKKKVNRYTGGILYRFVHRRPTDYDVTDVLLKPPKLRGWIHNPSAVLLAALAGTLRTGRVVIRSNEHNKARLRTRYSSRWDYIPSEHAEMRAFDWRWKSLVELNLTFYKV